MTVMELKRLLDKVKEKDADVLVNDTQSSNNLLTRVVIEHDVEDDFIFVVLKTNGN